MAEGRAPTAGPVEQALVDLAAQEATGCLVVRQASGTEAEVFLRDGRVYAVTVPGRRPLLGVRLLSSGALGPAALTDALGVQRAELPAWRLGELLVHLGHVDRGVVEAFVTEALTDGLHELLAWPVQTARFHPGRRTRCDVAPPVAVADLLATLGARRERWRDLVARVGDPSTVPHRTREDDTAPGTLPPDALALLSRVDGQTPLAELAVDCGLTVFEATEVLVALADAGLVATPVPEAAPLPRRRRLFGRGPA